MDYEPCGFCGGTGRVPNRTHDDEGRHRPDWPAWITCEYCDGAGECEQGRKLLPCGRPAPTE